MMTQEQKELLLKDLCARLPYGVKFHIEDFICAPRTLKTVCKDGRVTCEDVCRDIENIKPYLFPLSSMTEEQSKTYHELASGMFGTNILINFEVLTDFFNKNHLDFRGLIPMGLAIDATGLNIY